MDYAGGFSIGGIKFRNINPLPGERARDFVLRAISSVARIPMLDRPRAPWVNVETARGTQQWSLLYDSAERAKGTKRYDKAKATYDRFIAENHPITGIEYMRHHDPLLSGVDYEQVQDELDRSKPAQRKKIIASLQQQLDDQVAAETAKEAAVQHAKEVEHLRALEKHITEAFTPKPKKKRANK
jgi:hypothetical protein